MADPLRGVLRHEDPPQSPSAQASSTHRQEESPDDVVTIIEGEHREQPATEPTRATSQAKSRASSRRTASSQANRRLREMLMNQANIELRLAKAQAKILEAELKCTQLQVQELELNDSDDEETSQPDQEPDPSARMRVQGWLDTVQPASEVRRDQTTSDAGAMMSTLQTQAEVHPTPVKPTVLKAAPTPLPMHQAAAVIAAKATAAAKEVLKPTTAPDAANIDQQRIASRYTEEDRRLLREADAGRRIGAEIKRNLGETRMNMDELAAVITTATTAAVSASMKPRQVFELPTFNGAHTEWLSFQAAYRETEAHFTDTENTARLRKALRGTAKMAAASLLYTNKPAADIIEALEDRFGRPDALAMEEVERLKGLPHLTDAPKDIVLFANKVRNSVATLEALKKKHYLYNPETLKILVEKLTRPQFYRWMDYERTEHKEDEPMLLSFEHFIRREATWCGHYAKPEAIASQDSGTGSRQQDSRPKKFTRTYAAQDGISSPPRMKKPPACVVCKKAGHQPQACPKLKQADAEGRWELSRLHHLCFRCLTPRNWTHRCKPKRCGQGGCDRYHHPLLHLEKKQQQQPPQEEIVTSARCTPGATFLKIAPVQLTGPAGSINTYALLDDGSTVTLLDNEVAEKIGAVGTRDPLTLYGLGGAQLDHTSQRVSLHIKGQGEVFPIKARTIVGLNLVPQTVKMEDLEDCKHLMDIEHQVTYKDARPTLLIGQDNWHLLMASHIRRGRMDQPAASLTPLGWVLHGASGRSRGYEVHHIYHTSTERQDEDRRMDEELKRFFTLESLGITPKTTRGDPEQRALTLLREKTVEKTTGGYEAPLLWKEDRVELPINYAQAMKRLEHTERKLDRHPALKEGYKKQIEALLEKNYAEPTTGPGPPGKTWYLPHFAVLHPAKPGKVRVVFDAAARAKGTSLNDHLLPGPDLLQSLPGVLMRFRLHAVAVAADIEEMFLRIGIREEDRDVLRFLWRGDRREGPPIEYRMRVVIFGAACSPCTALFVKNLNAERHADKYPAAAKAIVHNHYMDDYLQSFATVEEAQKIAAEVDEVHQKANFKLKKWTSNVTEAVKNLQEKPSTEVVKLDDNTEKILGLMWNPRTDTLGFNLNFARAPADIVSGTRRPTKREALQTVMSVFDPLGLASPVTIQAKQILQETWRTGTGWDQKLPDHLNEKWLAWIRQLQQLRDIELPRCHFGLTNASSRELHTFVDASEMAYAAAVFWRIEDEDGHVKVSLVAAKSRVAPLKIASIPRLELQAAVLGCRLAKSVIEGYNIEPNKRIFWTDSKTVLAWLRAGPRTFKAFVAHRVAEIEEETTLKEWRWLPSRDNVADDATREVPSNFKATHRWFQGPEFLKQTEDSWPIEVSTTEVQPTGEERSHTLRTSQPPPGMDALPDIQRFSSWIRLVRTTARVLQFVLLLKKTAAALVNLKRTVRKKDDDPTWKRTGTSRRDIPPPLVRRQQPERLYIPLDATHTRAAERLWIQAVQYEAFPEERAALERGDTPAKDSRLSQLNVHQDDYGIIRLTSRIDRTRNISQSQKSPAILDGDHYFTKLFLKMVHEKLQHGGVETTVNEARQHYWILRLRPTVRTVVKSCLPCRIRRAKPAEPLTGNHPYSRLAHHRRPFSYVGLDYFGPLSITVGRRHEKRWVALFTCLTTRAVHLEIAPSLSADSAIMALRRMFARRGSPEEIFSDNGTNFHGANNELYAAMQDEAATRAIKWNFIPPGAPFMGGAWERLVRSVKTALYAVLEDRHPHEEVLATLLCEAEYTVNSRPLTHVSTSAEDEEALTPNHFLLGGSGNVRQPGSFDDGDLDLKNVWRRSQRLADIFWERWIREYLPELQHRREPRGSGDPLRVGDLVIIVDSSLPRNTWPRGRVINVFPGEDGVVRAADVKTAGGVLRRPTKKLVVLPS